MAQRSPPPSPAPQPSVVEITCVPTPEIQNWMTSIEQCLNEICSIAAEGKLNSDQKLRINKLCRSVGQGTSQMVVQYQSLKNKALLAQATSQALNEKLDLSKSLREMKTTIEETYLKPQTNLSFADIVKKSTDNFVRPSNLSSVAIYPNDKLKTSEDTKNLVQKIICPEQMKLHVRGVRKTRNGGVIISTESKDDAEKLKHSSVLTSSGFTVVEPSKRNPRIIILGVPSSMGEKELCECLYEQNLADKIQNMSQDAIMSSIKLSHKSGKKDAQTCNFVLEVPAQIRKILISQERVYLNWSSLTVRDFTMVTRCFKCQQYGHAAKTCRETVPACGHCGELGHMVNECTKKAESPKCATCLRFKKPSNHKTGDVNCPARKMAENRYINSVDYGGA